MTSASTDDKLAIRETYGRYALAVSHKDTEVWLGCWSNDALWKTPQFEARGQAALRGCWDATWTMFGSVAVFNELGAITLSGDRATLESMVFEVVELVRGGTTRMVGRYADELVRDGDVWRFDRRTYTAINVEAPAGAAGK